MPLIRDGQIIEDNWTTVDDLEALPASGDIIVSLYRFLAERPALVAREGRLGLAIDNAIDPDDIQGFLGDVDLISLEFPAFTDGRAYSQAHHLRTHLGFTGELRATGVVLADQAAFLTRVGFDTFETVSNQPLEVWKRAATSMTVAYQRGYTGPQTTRQL